MYRFYFDCGTSNIRGYLLEDRKVVGWKQLGIGSKDVSISSSREILINGLKSIYDEVIGAAGISDTEVAALYASGMVTSPYGLVEVPHALLPLDKEKIRESIFVYHEDSLFHRTINLIRGAKTAEGPLSMDSIDSVNNFRGEEMEVLGACSHIPRDWKCSKYIILLPGSHTHAILLENETLIDIFSIFSGEIFHALTTATILSSSTDVKNRTVKADREAIRFGCDFFRKYGFARAVYIVHAMKIFDVADNSKRRDCLSSIVISSVVQSLLSNMEGKWSGVTNIAISGAKNIVETYSEVIRQLAPGINVLLLPHEEAGTASSVEGFISLTCG